jgi:hypothetical protein
MFCESVWADSVFPIITDPMGSSKTFAFMEKRGIRWPSNIAANMRHDRVAELIAEILPLQTGR